MIYYSASTHGFSSDASHGPRRISIPDPSWVRPKMEDGSPDLEAQQPTIEIDNPDCKIPADAEPISDADHKALIDGQAAGQMIVHSGKKPALVPRPPASTADMINKVLVALETERDRLRYAPISYGGTLFDADADSQALISGTLARLTRGDGLPTPWVGWRDHANIQHWDSDDAAAVAAHLRSLAGRIENREASIRVASWQKKAEVIALETVSAIQSYPVQTGWNDEPT